MRCGTFKRLQSTCFLKSMKKDDGTPVNDFRGGVNIVDVTLRVLNDMEIVD